MNFNLTKNFTFYELTNTNNINLLEKNREEGLKYKEKLKELSNLLEEIRKLYNKPIKITSGFRCSKLNKLIGGSSESQHKKGEAADFTIVNENVENVYTKILESNINWGQLIIYPERGFIHISLPREDKENKIHGIEFRGVINWANG